MDEVRDTTFLFRVPERYEPLSDGAYAAIALAGLSERLSQEKRTRVEHADRRPENVLEHTGTLVKVAPFLVERFYPQLNVGVVALFASVHDDPEAYVGDVATDRISVADLAAKRQREAKGVQQLVGEFAHSPFYTDLVRRYEEQNEPEARVVRVIDKLLPLLLHLSAGGHVLKDEITAEELRKNSQLVAAELRKDYPEFEAIIAIREELAELAIERYLQVSREES